MTAVAGVLNKQAVAIAADSAVTIGSPNSRKIFNKANKVFALSKQHPVGIMIYNSASFMGTPWETIIKIYRKKLGDESFPTIKQYQENFIEFLRSKEFYTNADTQINRLQDFALYIIDFAIDEVIVNNRLLVESMSSADKAAFIKLFEKRIDAYIELWSRSTEYCPEFMDYTFEVFQRYSTSVFDEILESRFLNNELEVSNELLVKIEKIVYIILRAKETWYHYTGLIFTGFGEDEIYPQLIPINISMVVDNRLRYYIDEDQNTSISNNNPSGICRFAQTDVIDTILTGIDPSLDNIYLKNFDKILTDYNKAILGVIGDTNPLLSEQIKNVDNQIIIGELGKLNNEIRKEHYIIPLHNAVISLAKEDLAEMAESLIYLTYLKRRITFAEESVGGPVDVAIISKGDGFIWIKRKHYFTPELNHHFFNNYFK